MNVTIKNASIHIDRNEIYIHISQKDLIDVPNRRGRMKMYCPDSTYAFYILVYNLSDTVTLFVWD